MFGDSPPTQPISLPLGKRVHSLFQDKDKFDSKTSPGLFHVPFLDLLLFPGGPEARNSVTFKANHSTCHAPKISLSCLLHWGGQPRDWLAFVPPTIVASLLGQTSCFFTWSPVTRIRLSLNFALEVSCCSSISVLSCGTQVGQEQDERGIHPGVRLCGAKQP